MGNGTVSYSNNSAFVNQWQLSKTSEIALTNFLDSESPVLWYLIHNSERNFCNSCFASYNVISWISLFMFFFCELNVIPLWRLLAIALLCNYLICHWLNAPYCYLWKSVSLLIFHFIFCFCVSMSGSSFNNKNNIIQYATIKITTGIISHSIKRSSYYHLFAYYSNERREFM